MEIDSIEAKRRRKLIALIAAHVIASVALCGIAHGRDNIEPQVACLVLAVSQTALLGFWIGAGRMGLRLRSALVCLAMPLIWSSIFFGVRGLQTVTEGLVVAALVAALALASAMSGFFLRQAGVGIGLAREMPADPAAARIQFSLLAIFLFTTGAAIAVACILAARQQFTAKTVFDSVALLCVAILGTTVAIEWGALSRRSIRWRLLALLVAIGITLPVYFIDGNWTLTTFLLLQAAISTGTLLLVRSLGYRLFVHAARFAQ